MMMLGLMAGAAAYLALKWMKLPKHERCPVGRRKKARKVQSEARRRLRDPKHRGDRASHREARRLLRLTRKSRPVKPRVLTPEQMAIEEQHIQNLIAKWAFERSQEIAKGVSKVVYEDSDSIITEEPRGPLVRCRCSVRYTYPQFLKLQMLENTTFDGGTTHVKACSICGADLRAEVFDIGEDGKPRYVNNIHLDEEYQREKSDKQVKEGLDP
jgi:hypothetical protein